MKHFLTSLGIVLLVAMILVGCGAAVAPAGERSVLTSKGGVSASPPMPAAAPPMVAATAQQGAASDSLGSPSVEAAVAPERLIIRNGNMVLIVVDVKDAVDKIAAIANDAGGLVLRTDSHHEGDLLYATVTIKVPAETFDAVTARLRDLAVKVDSDNSSSLDVTEEYVDLDARLKVYEATEQQLLKFLEQTKDVDESLKVYRELTNVRSQIESLKGRMNYLKNSAAMSSITVQVRPQESSAIVQETGWSPTKVLRNVLRWLVAALQLLFYLLVFVIFGLIPVLLIVAIPLLILRVIWRRLRKPKSK